MNRHFLSANGVYLLVNTEQYQEVDKTVSLGMANVVAALLFIPALLLFILPYVLLHGNFRYETATSLLESVALLTILFVSVVIHELLHGVGYKWAGAKLQSIKFGFKQMTPFAHCGDILPVNGYRLAVALPGLVLGILPGVIGILVENASLALFGGVMLGTAGGDILILWLIRGAPHTALVQDHPSAVGCKLLLPKETAPATHLAEG